MATEKKTVIRARLTTGEVVELARDCSCVIHDGPHWLHMDDVDKSLNRRLRDRDRPEGEMRENISIY